MLDLDFTQQNSDNIGEGWSWNNENRILTLSGVSINSINLPANSVIVLKDGTKNNVISDKNVAINCAGSLKIMGETAGTGSLEASYTKVDALKNGIALVSNTDEDISLIIENCTVIANGRNGILANTSKNVQICIRNANVVSTTPQKESGYYPQSAINAYSTSGDTKLEIINSDVTVNAHMFGLQCNSEKSNSSDIEILNSKINANAFASAPIHSIGKTSSIINISNSEVLGETNSNSILSESSAGKAIVNIDGSETRALGGDIGINANGANKASTKITNSVVEAKGSRQGAFQVESNGDVVFSTDSESDITVESGNHGAIVSTLGSVDYQSKAGNMTIMGTGIIQIKLKDSSMPAINKKGYVFKGWYEDENFSGNPVTNLKNDVTYYANFVEKTEPTISFKDDLKLDKAYDGQAVSISENDYTLTDGAGDVTFTYQMKNGDTWADVTDVPVNVGTYRVKAVVAENDNYKGAETDWKEFTIRKAKPAYTLPDDLVIGKGKTLATVTLPNGFAWADETQTADELGTHEFKAVYTPEDTANYETVEVMIPVEVVPNTSQVNHAPEIEVSDKTLTVGDAFDPMENVVVKDKEDKAEDLVVDVTHNVDMSKAGVYEVTYTVTDTKGAVTVKKIYVTVNPKTDVLNEVPTIHAENVTITVGDQFDPLKDVTAADKEDGTLTDKIEVLNNSVDVNKAGVYEVTYKVTDSNGATVTKTITVTVKEKEAGTPTPPEKPSAPSQPDNPTKPDSTTKPDNTAKPGDPTKPNKTDTPKTGDMANFGVFASMLAGSSGALAVLWKKRRKDNEND